MIAERAHGLGIPEANYLESYFDSEAILATIEQVPSDFYGLRNPSDNFPNFFQEGAVPPIGLNPSGRIT